MIKFETPHKPDKFKLKYENVFLQDKNACINIFQVKNLGRDQLCGICETTRLEKVIFLLLYYVKKLFLDIGKVYD